MTRPLTELSDALKAEIQEGYRRFLRHRELNPRLGQRQMIGAIASSLGSVAVNDEGEREGAPGVCAVEAGTGTGKTLAYLLPALPVARARGKKVVVATATVSLQSQLMDKDIPELLEATGWKYRFALAKGRGRYLCNLKLERARDAVGASDAGLYLFEDELPLGNDRRTGELIRVLDESLRAETWSGDRDTWPEAISDADWRALTVDRRQCGGHRCRLVSECCFFRARADLEDADCIVANHDLVMADLALGGGVILPSPEDTIYIFDEAHRLGDTTLRHFSGSCHLQGTLQWLEQLEKNFGVASATAAEDPGLVRLLDTAEQARQEAATELRQAQPLFRAALDEGLPAGATQYRFPLGDIGPGLRGACQRLEIAFTRLLAALETLSESVEKQLEGGGQVPKVDLEQLFQGAGTWRGRAEAVAALWQQMAREDPPGTAPRARWLAVADSGQDILACVSPIAADELLRDNLWQRAFAVVATSATLRALGRFDRFAAAVGLPADARTLSVPGAFDFERAAVLAVPDIGADGGSAAAHTEAVIASLPELVDREEGTLVLFASRRQMREVAEGLSDPLRHQVLMQGELSHAEIVRRHKSEVDAGRGSAIFGLASFAEGLDLPGEYCRHVIIAKLPFAVPDDPLQAAQAEWLETRGINPFRALTLPDASLRLVQACGRLLRSETDSGRVTILDRRLLTKFYGPQLLDSLPPFRRQID